MGLIYQKIIRPILFRQDPERAHDIAVSSLHLLGEFRPLASLMEAFNKLDAKPLTLFGLNFPNRVGIAAGFDKNAQFIKAVSALGFGHIEVGTITLQRQPGNPKPRLFRFPDQEAIINRMGFNNDGAQKIAKRLAKTLADRPRNLPPVGVNIGKSKATPLEEAVEDYVGSFNLLADYADYFTINVSSPNTPGLRSLQNKEYLLQLLSELKKANIDRSKKMGCEQIPMLLKIAPDLEFTQVDEILEIIQNLQFSGIVATNTTLQRPGSFKNIDCSGGLSGRPLHSLSADMIKYISLSTQGKLPIVGVGGIMGPESAQRTVDAGASLVQLYTGLIYNGPFLGRVIAKALAPQDRDWV